MYSISYLLDIGGTISEPISIPSIYPEQQPLSTIFDNLFTAIKNISNIITSLFDGIGKYLQLLWKYVNILVSISDFVPMVILPFIIGFVIVAIVKTIVGRL